MGRRHCSPPIAASLPSLSGYRIRPQIHFDPVCPEVLQDPSPSPHGKKSFPALSSSEGTQRGRSRKARRDPLPPGTGTPRSVAMATTETRPLTDLPDFTGLRSRVAPKGGPQPRIPLPTPRPPLSTSLSASVSPAKPCAGEAGMLAGAALGPRQRRCAHPKACRAGQLAPRRRPPTVPLPILDLWSC